MQSSGKTVSKASLYPQSRSDQFPANRLRRSNRRLTLQAFVAVAVMALFAAFSAAAIHAQGYGTISGSVTDPSGAVVSGASVTATQTLSGELTTTVTGKDGRYVFPTLLPAPYALRFPRPVLSNTNRLGSSSNPTRRLP
jgi:hypothetical protein